MNPFKSKVFLFKKGRVNRNESCYYSRTELTVAMKISYFGLVFTTNGQNYQMQLALSEQANKAVFQLHRIITRFHSMSVLNVLDLFDKLIAPILNYGSEVWGFHQASDIECVQLSFRKHVLGVKINKTILFMDCLVGCPCTYLDSLELSNVC